MVNSTPQLRQSLRHLLLATGQYQGAQPSVLLAQDIEALICYGTFRQVKSGAFLAPSEITSNTFLVLYGLLALTDTHEGRPRRSRHRWIEPWGLFRTEMFQVMVHQLSLLEAVTNCTLMQLTDSSVQGLMHSSSRLAMSFLTFKLKAIEATTTHLELLHWNLTQRIALLLCKLAKQHTVVACRPHLLVGHITLHLSHSQIATLIGTHRESVSVAMRHLRQQGLVETGRCRIVVLNVDALQQFAFLGTPTQAVAD